MTLTKVLYIHHGKGLGGASLSLLLLIKALDKTKFKPTVLFLHDSDAVKLYRQHGIDIAGIVNRYDFSHTKIWWFRWYHLPYLIRSAWDTFKTQQSIACKWLNKIKPNIVHLNTSSLIAWGKAAHKKGIPVIWHIREPLAEGYLGIRRWIVKNYVKKYSTKILPICKNDAKPWIKNSKTQVVYNAVDPIKFDFNESAQDFLNRYQMKQATPKILFLGGLSEEKGTLVIFQAFEKVLKQIPDAQLIVAGYFDLNINNISVLKKFFPAYKFKLKVLDAYDKIKHALILTGPIQNVSQAMATSDIIVFPATVGHFARPIIEAGFMKKPVLASRIPPLDEIVIDKKTGFLIDFKNTAEWAKKLTQLLTNKDLNKKMGEAGYKFCSRNFSIQNQIKIIENIYGTVFSTRFKKSFNLR
jgi:glycosyltransferase involved in cell wall biosynthesis